MFSNRQQSQISKDHKLTFKSQMARVYHMNDEVLEVRSTILAKYEGFPQRNSSTL